MALASAATRWGAHAECYEQVFERTTVLWGRDALTLGRLPDPQTSRFLDVACGPGSLALEAAGMGYAVVATDFSSGMIDRVKAKIASSLTPLKISARVVDGQTLEGIEDSSFDVVASTFGIALFPDRAAAWKSALRVLTPGGRLVATSWDANSVNLRMVRFIIQHSKNKPGTPVSQHDALPTAINNTMQAVSFREELESCGFEAVRIHSLSHPMCFSSGEECVRGILDNAGFMTMVSHKEAHSVKRCVLEFAQLVLDGVDPSEVIRVRDAPAENHPLWSKPFALQAVGHLAVASKPTL